MHFKRTAVSGSMSRHVKIVPLVGILFLLLLFLTILSGLLISSQGVRVHLPKFLTGQGLMYESIELVVNSADGVYLNGSPVSLDGLKNYFLQVSKRKPALMIKAEKKASLGLVMEICDLARRLGIVEVRLVSAN